MEHKRNTCQITLAVFLLSINNISAAAQETQPSVPDLQSTAQYNDPVELAKKIIRETPDIWSLVGRTAIWGVYYIGGGVAEYGGAYVLLECPKLTPDLISGDFIHVSDELLKDFILHIIEESVETPRITCQKIANQTIDEGYLDYEIARGIANKYLKTNQLTRDDAVTFLEKRYGLYKLSAARKLRNSVDVENYSVNEVAAEIAKNEMKNIFYAKYKETYLPLEAAFFLKELQEIMEKDRVGLAVYSPYREFVANIEKIDQWRIEEAKRLGIIGGHYSNRTWSESFDDGNYTANPRWYEYDNNGSCFAVTQKMGHSASPCLEGWQGSAGTDYTALYTPINCGAAFSADFWVYKRTQTFSIIQVGFSEGPYSSTNRGFFVLINYNNMNNLLYMIIYDAKLTVVSNQQIQYDSDRWINLHMVRRSNGDWTVVWDYNGRHQITANVHDGFASFNNPHLWVHPSGYYSNTGGFYIDDMVISSP